jgi:hypothetical protein
LSGTSSKADYDTRYDSGLFEEEDIPPPPKRTAATAPTTRRSPFVTFLSRGGWLLILILVGAAIGLINKSQDANSTSNTNTGYASSTFSSSLQDSNAPSSQTNTATTFPMQSASCNTQGCPQYTWYDNNNVAMAYRCYPGSGCTAQQWAYAVYGNSNDPRGQSLKEQADIVSGTISSQYPAGKCVTESGVQICDLSYNTTGSTGTNRTVKMQGNEIICLDLTTGNTTDVRADTSTINTDPQVCASDSGSVYIDPTITVGKHFGAIQTGTSSYTVPSSYSQCIWTYNGGNGDIPYIQTGGATGPDTSFYNVHAFCQNGSNEVDILTTST